MRWGGGEEDATAADWSKFPSRVVFSCPWSSHLSLTFNVHLFLLKVSLRVMVIAEQTGSTPRQKNYTQIAALTLLSHLPKKKKKGLVITRPPRKWKRVTHEDSPNYLSLRNERSAKYRNFFACFFFFFVSSSDLVNNTWDNRWMSTCVAVNMVKIPKMGAQQCISIKVLSCCRKRGLVSERSPQPDRE